MRLIASVCAALMLAGCSERAPTEAAPEHDGVIRAGSGPIAFVAQRLAEGVAAVELPVPEGADPATWRPGFDVIADYQGSMLIVLNGAGFEQWADSAALPNSRVVRTADAAGFELIRSKEVTHTHGTEGSHQHGGVNPHTWLDPALLSKQAEALCEAMQAFMPEHGSAFNDNLSALQMELAELAEAWQAVDVSGVSLMARGDAHVYLARAANWDVEADESASTERGVVVLDDAIDLGASASAEDYLAEQHASIERLAQAAAKARNE